MSPTSLRRSWPIELPSSTSYRARRVGGMSTPRPPRQITLPGLRPTDTRGVEQWINGPDFLRCDEGEWPVRPKEIKVLPDDALEWKKDVSVYESRLQQVDPLDSLVQHYSSWYRLLKALAWLVRFSNHLQASHRATNPSSGVLTPDVSTGAGTSPLSVAELQRAKTRLFRYVQRLSFPQEVACLESGSSSSPPSKAAIKKSSKLSNLSPFMGKDGVLRVGGRLERAELSFDAKHPI